MRYARKKNLKIAHASTFVCVMFLTIFGLIAVFDSHNYARPPIPNLYSLHSWIGLAAVILFGLQVITCYIIAIKKETCKREKKNHKSHKFEFQWIGGFVTFLYPQLRGSYKSTLLPYHIFFGLLGYVLEVIAALLGLSEKAFFKM